MGGRGQNRQGGSKKATAETNRQLRTQLRGIAQAEPFINQAVREMEPILKDAPKGTVIEIPMYRNHVSTYEKTGKDTWEKTWGTSRGKVYWTTKQPTHNTAIDMYNDFVNQEE